MRISLKNHKIVVFARRLPTHPPPLKQVVFVNPENGLSGLALARWLRTTEAQHRIDQLAQTAAVPSPGQIEKLRAQVGVQRAAVLIDQAQRVHRAAKKFGNCLLPTRHWLVTDRSLQQATDQTIAAHKAQVFPRDHAIVDLCCGVGGDAIALAKRGPLVAVDQDPQCCHFTAHNLSAAGCDQAVVLCTDAETFFQKASPKSAWVDAFLHLDPDRRPGTKRIVQAELASPDLRTVAFGMNLFAGGGIKMAPAADLPSTWQRVTHRQWISFRGECRQQVVWFGAIGPDQSSTAPGTRGTVSRSATLVREHAPPFSWSIREDRLREGTPATASAPGMWLADFDPAVRAAGLTLSLAASMGFASLGGPAGFFTADQLVAEPQGAITPNPLVQLFQVLWSGPFDLRQLRKTLRTIPCQHLEIKVRGVGVTPETLRSQLLAGKNRNSSAVLSGIPTREYTILIGTRDSGRSYAALAQRIAR